MPSITPAVREQVASAAHAELALRILQRLLRGFVGNATLRLWNNRSYKLGRGTPDFTLVLREPTLLRRLIMARSPVLLADA